MTDAGAGGSGAQAAFASTAPLAPGRRATALDWAPALLLLCVTGYVVSYLSVRGFVPSAFIVLAAPLPLALRMLARPMLDRANVAIVATMLALVAWMLIQLGWATPLVHLGIGRASLYAAAAAIALAVACGRSDPDALFAAIGMGGLLPLVIAVHGMSRFGYDGYGLGNPNHLLNACAPADIAWVAFLVVRAWERRPAPPWQYVAAAIFTTLLWYEVFYAIPGYPRRGVIVATAAAAAGIALHSLWRARPALAAALATAGVIAAIAGGAWILGHRPEDARSERFGIYAAAAQAGLEALPWGGGSYASLRLEDSPGEAVRHLLATNVWMLHVHCELLEELLCGGVVGVLLSFAWVCALASRALAIADGAQRAAALGAGIALVVHANTDNAYAIPACIGWAGVLVGTVMRCPTAQTAAAVAWARPLALALALATACAAVREVPATILARSSPPEERMAAIRLSAMADFHVSQWADAVDPLLNAGRLDEAADFVALMRRRVAGASNTGYARCVIWSRIGARSRDALAESLGRVTDHPIPGLADAIAAAAAAARADEEEFAATLVQLRRNPFNRLGYDHLDEVLSRRPDLIPRAPPDAIVRLRYRRGDRGLPPPTWIEPRTVDSAADLFAGIMWAHQRGWTAERTGPGLEMLLRRYGDVPDVCLLAVEMMRDLPAGSFPWIAARRDAIAHASEKIFPADRVRLLESVTRPEQAAAVWTALSWMYPATAESLRRDRMNYLRDNYDPIWSNLVRIWGLKRLDARIRPAPVP